MKYGIYGLVLYLSSERGEMEEKKWDCEFSSNPPIITFVRSFFSFSRIFFEYFKLCLLKIFSTSHVMRKFTLSFPQVPDMICSWTFLQGTSLTSKGNRWCDHVAGPHFALSFWVEKMKNDVNYQPCNRGSFAMKISTS